MSEAQKELADLLEFLLIDKRGEFGTNQCERSDSFWTQVQKSYINYRV